MDWWFVAAATSYVIARRARILQWAKAGSAKKTDCSITGQQQQGDALDTDTDSDGQSQVDRPSPADTRGETIAEECALDEYEQFDDYLEMVIQLGYIQLFAAAFPLAGEQPIVPVLLQIAPHQHAVLWQHRFRSWRTSSRFEQMHSSWRSTHAGHMRRGVVTLARGRILPQL